MDQPARGGVRGCLGNQEKEPLRNPGLDKRPPKKNEGAKKLSERDHAHRARMWGQKTKSASSNEHADRSQGVLLNGLRNVRNEPINAVVVT